MSGGKVFRSPASSATLRSLVMLSGASCPAEMAAEGGGLCMYCEGERRGGACRLGRRRLKRGRPRRLESLPAALFVVGDTELAEHAVFGPYFQQKLLARADRRSTSQRFSCRSAPSRTGTLLRGQALRCRHVHGFPHPLRLRAAWNRSRTSWLF